MDSPNQPNGTSPSEIAGSIDRTLAHGCRKIHSGEESEVRSEAAQRQQLVGRLAAELGARYAPSRARVSTFEVYDPSRQKPVIEQLLKLAGALDHLTTAGNGLVFLGTVGTGKDHLMAAMLYHAASKFGIAGHWVNGQEVFGAFRDRIDTGQRDEEYFRALVQPRILAISDPIPPVGNLGNWDTGNLYRIIDRRYRALRPTWVSLNALDESDADARLSQPVFDRIREGAEILKCFWESYRERVEKTVK